MKAIVKIKKEVDIKTLHVEAGVRYWEDGTVNDVDDEAGDLMPCREGDLWKPIIDVETGKVLNWEQGKKAEVHFKVCDNGRYFLKDANDETIMSIIDDYVPKMLCPKENGYGDYIIMDIDETGQIANWKQTLDGFESEDD